MALAAAPALAAASDALLVREAERGKIRGFLNRDPAAAKRIAAHADKMMKAGPWSVTHHRPNNPRVARNDYYSEAPYWWPDPKNPGGPYIRKDGERYPDRNFANRIAIGEMSEAVLSLGMAAAFLGREAAARRAAMVLSVWFLDPKTRMNPHLEFGQAIMGRNEGRGAGIIETVSLIYCAQGILLLEAAGGLDAKLAGGLRSWYAEYLRWMTTSKKGVDEMNARNNHATWWTAQVAAFAVLTGDAAAQRLAWDRYREHLLPTQVQPDGRCPQEEARTRSLSYSAMNLDGFSVLCRIAQMRGVDLWRYKTPKGIGIEKSFYYLLPYVLDPKSWRKPQITSFDQDRVVYPGLAGLGLGSAELLGAYRRLPRADAPWVNLVSLLVSAA